MKTMDRRARGIMLKAVLWSAALAGSLLILMVSGAVAQEMPKTPITSQITLPQTNQGPTPALQPGAEEATPPWDGVPAGYMIIEGDVIVPIDFYQRHRALSPEGTWATNFWPNGDVPYVFDANVTMANQAAMLAAMAQWEAIAQVDFYTRTTESDYIHIRNSNGNSSMVGMIGGRQYIDIFNWNVRFIMVHELGHALGLWHEQSRPNRDAYVQINLQNVCQTCCNNGGSCNNNFAKHREAGEYPRNGYDFDSVMHYDQCAFSTQPNCPTGGGETITVLSPNQAWQPLIGQRTHLSDLDRLTMSFLYPQLEWRFVDGAYTGSASNGSFLMPYKTFPAGVSGTPSGGTLWIQPGTYSAVGTYHTPMTLRAPLDGVVLQP